MDFLKKLFSDPPAGPQSNFHTFGVKCSRCGEVIESHINLNNDLSLEDDGSGYFIRKTLMGNGKCFQRIEVEMKFDGSKHLIEKHAQGGTFV